MHVDDGLCRGDTYFQEQRDKLEAIFPFGSKRSGNFVFTGIQVSQSSDKSITLSQEKCIGQIQPIQVNATRRTSLESAVSPEERCALRGLIGSLQYAAVNARPHLSSRLSTLQSQINQATVSMLIEANRALHEAKRYKDVSIHIQPIPVHQLRFLTFSNASFASKKEPDSHTGLIIMATHEDNAKNATCAVNPVSWG